jgi:dipeptidyl aminopeptidase/acylaminoacyl peptidase
MQQVELGGKLAAGLALVLLVGLGNARAAQKPRRQYAHAYDAAGPGGGGEIFAMSTDGSSQVNLTNDPSADDEYPGWSADGSKIAYTNIGPNGDPEIFAMNADGSNKHDLSNDAAYWDFDPEWSPDGSLLVWARAVAGVGDYDIWVMHADGTNQTQLTSAVGFDGYSVWSPDGTQIAFARQVGDLSDIFVMNADAFVVPRRRHYRLHAVGPVEWGLGHLRDGCRRFEPRRPDEQPDHRGLRPGLVGRRDEDRVQPERRIQSL